MGLSSDSQPSSTRRNTAVVVMSLETEATRWGSNGDAPSLAYNSTSPALTTTAW